MEVLMISLKNSLRNIFVASLLLAGTATVSMNATPPRRPNGQFMKAQTPEVAAPVIEQTPKDKQIVPNQAQGRNTPIVYDITPTQNKLQIQQDNLQTGNNPFSHRINGMDKHSKDNANDDNQ